MKNYVTHGTLGGIFIMLLHILPFAASAQPDYSFTGASLVAGTALQTGAVYKYSNVRTGTDAFVTITGMTGSMTLAAFDGSASGFNEAFQPTINCANKKKGYVEFQVDFVVSGPGTNKALATPKVMTEVPVTALDIDGFGFPDGTSKEFNEFKTTPSYYVDYNMVGGELAVTNSGGFYTAANTAAIIHTGIDTTTAGRVVMFSIVYANVSSITFRLGDDNTSTSNDSRQTSVYFKKFSYPHSFLALLPNQNIPAVVKNQQPGNRFRVFPSIVQNNMTLEVASDNATTGLLQLVDYTGNVVHTQTIYLQAGINSIPVHEVRKLRSGAYIATLHTGASISTQKIIKF